VIANTGESPLTKGEINTTELRCVLNLAADSIIAASDAIARNDTDRFTRAMSDLMLHHTHAQWLAMTFGAWL
jgi:hypothetical protein